jgi:phosphoadenosine phosphosulfate reductase
MAMSAVPRRIEHCLEAPMTSVRTVSHLKIVTFDKTSEESQRRPVSGLPQPGPGFERLEPTPELLAELAAASARLESASPEEVIAWGIERYAPYLTMATAFGPEGCVILAMLAKIAPETYVFNLDTGYQFQETLELRDRIAEKYGLEVDLLKPELGVEEYEAVHGGPLYRTNPNQCCHDRKIKTLERASAVMHAWMSGIRRDQSADRAQAKIIGWDKKFGLVKISPLANWTKKDVWKRITDEGVPYNPLHDQGYPSIGCWPCTRAVAAGETDERAGRWSGMKKTECGLHSISEQDGSGI